MKARGESERREGVVEMSLLERTRARHCNEDESEPWLNNMSRDADGEAVCCVTDRARGVQEHDGAGIDAARLVSPGIEIHEMPAARVLASWRGLREVKCTTSQVAR